MNNSDTVNDTQGEIQKTNYNLNYIYSKNVFNKDNKRKISNNLSRVRDARVSKDAPPRGNRGGKDKNFRMKGKINFPVLGNTQLNRMNKDSKKEFEFQEDCYNKDVSYKDLSNVEVFNKDFVNLEKANLNYRWNICEVRNRVLDIHKKKGIVSNFNNRSYTTYNNNKF